MIDKISDLKYEFQSPTKEHQEKENTQKRILEFVGKSHNCCVCLVDVMDSTKLVSTIHESKTGLFYSILLNGLADIVKKNRGNIVKSIGDALLFYFDDSVEDYIRTALRCGLEMIESRDKINETLRDENLPPINYRVSGDFGKVAIGYSSVSVVEDIFGSVVNLCSKINSLGNPNSMVVGNDFYMTAKLFSEFKFHKITKNPLIGFNYSIFDVHES